MEARTAQAAGLVPIVEPEVLLDGEHDIDRTLEVAEATWAETFKYLADNKVLFEGILLKPSMVTPGAEAANRSTPEQVADYTLKLLTRRVPPAVPGAPVARGGSLFCPAGVAELCACAGCQWPAWVCCLLGGRHMAAMRCGGPAFLGGSAGADMLSGVHVGLSAWSRIAASHSNHGIGLTYPHACTCCDSFRLPELRRHHVPIGRAVGAGGDAEPERNEPVAQPVARVVLVRARPAEQRAQELAGAAWSWGHPAHAMPSATSP